MSCILCKERLSYLLAGGERVARRRGCRRALAVGLQARELGRFSLLGSPATTSLSEPCARLWFCRLSTAPVFSRLEHRCSIEA